MEPKLLDLFKILAALRQEREPMGTDINIAARLIRLENVIRALRADDDALERRRELAI